MRIRILLQASLLSMILAVCGVAQAASDASSVAVQMTKLKKGSLPRVLTAYGSVKAGSSARETVMAPVSATVSDVYVQAGQEVARGAPLVRLTPSPGTSAAFDQAQTALHVASALVERTKKMVSQHLATQQQLADAGKSEADAKSNLAALRAQGADGPNTLRAPYHAVITTLSASPGAIVAQGSALLELARPEGLVLSVGVIPSRAGAVAQGNPVKITPLGEDAAAAGKVLLRSSLVDPATGLTPIQISLPANGGFVSGEMARADITTGEVQGFVVPHEAILVNDQGEPYVVQAVEKTARQIPVQILGSQDDKDVISGKLDANAPVVLTGNYQLQDGMKLELEGPDGKAVK